MAIPRPPRPRRAARVAGRANHDDQSRPASGESTDTVPGTPTPPDSPDRSRSSRSLATVAKWVAGTVGAALIAIALTYYWAPAQDQRVEDGRADAAAAQDSTSPGAIVSDVFTNGDDVSHATDSMPNVAGVMLPRGAGKKISDALPGWTPLGDPVFDKTTDRITSGAEVPVYFTLTGNHIKTVRITDITIITGSRAPTPAGTIALIPPQGQTPNLQMGFDADSDDASARTLNEHEQPTDSHYFRENTVTLAKDESVGFVTKVVTSDCVCTFSIKIQFDDNSSVSIDRNSNNEPLSIAAYRTQYGKYYVPQSNEDGEYILVECSSLDQCWNSAYQSAPG